MEKRRRTENFTNDERATLMELVAKYQVVVDSRKTDTQTNAEKLQVWRNITEEFNQLSNHCYRYPEHLRTCWENLKRRRKKFPHFRFPERFRPKTESVSSNGSNYAPEDIVETIVEDRLGNNFNGHYSNSNDQVNGRVDSSNQDRNIIKVELLDEPEPVLDITVLEERTSPLRKDFFKNESPCSFYSERNFQNKESVIRQKRERENIYSKLRPYNWRRRKPETPSLSDQLLKEEIALARDMRNHAEEEHKLKMLILKEQLKQEKLKTQNLQNDL